MKLNLPNILSILRIILIPLFIIFFSDPSVSRSQWAALIFAIASVTDWFDGYIARKWGQVTLSGKFLDPVADKLLVMSALIMLVEINRVSSWIAIIIIGRELAITGLRAIASSVGVVIAAKEMGKYKTIMQMFSITFLILGYSVYPAGRQIDLHLLGTVGLWAAALLSVISAFDYFYRFWNNIAQLK
ncbi:MAG: CDP-diacylglycerol--glycerol-3-phosphate 3-phosphatidyltransferase [Nitrospirae bacterium RIFCSPHIGHO2_02_FULL_40_19]|nr:MAG: CDP-diacylglycerol--glycerol-3-phosphate 3-phosphatidyltransferase [Nitrospirae bacterium RIFCSPHIGHO2_02_FULL_40_19]